MGKKLKLGLVVVALVGLGVLTHWYFDKYPLVVLEPKGTIGEQQRDLMVTATLLGLLVIIPVFIMTFLIAWRYRETNHKAHYTPDWDHNVAAEAVWWAIPMAIITVLSVMTWTSTHKLDPSRPIASNTKPLTIQVVALEWKWLFIYPEQNIATVNTLAIPTDRPVNFKITSDAPMNAFWIPQLGGQVYAMAGMSSNLHLMADHSGDYRGSSGNISGKGFAGMDFVAKARSQNEFDSWVKTVKQSPDELTMSAYDKLAQPSQNNPPAYYSSKANNLYSRVVTKYMSPGSELQSEGKL